MKRSLPVVLLVLFGSVSPQSPPVSQFRVVRQWKYINFTWPDEPSYLAAIEKGLYHPKHIVLKRVKFYDNSYYLSLPRMKSGTPATLARIPEGLERGTSPLLEPYPSWTMNTEGDCNALQNVQGIEIDSKGQMWILDLGHTSLLEQKVQRKCSPKIVIHNINSNRTMASYTFPQSVLGSGSYLYDLVVDGGYAYITDNSADNPGIVVFSLKEKESWKISHARSMSADRSAVEFRLNGIAVSYPINIAAVALSPSLRTSNERVVISENRDVFYCPLSSHHLYSIDTDVLRNRTNRGEYLGDVKSWGVKASQTDAMIMDNQGILYYSLLSDNSIGLWNSRTPFPSGQKVVARDNTYIQWVSAFSFDNKGNLTVLSNRLQNFISYGEFNVSQYNFWLLMAHTGGRSYVYDFNDYQPLPTTSGDYDETEEPNNLNVNGKFIPTTTTTTTTTTSRQTATMTTATTTTTPAIHTSTSARNSVASSNASSSNKTNNTLMVDMVKESSKANSPRMIKTLMGVQIVILSYLYKHC